MAVNNFFPALSVRGPMPAFYASQENQRANQLVGIQQQQAQLQQQALQNQLEQQQRVQERDAVFNTLLQQYIGPDGAGLAPTPDAAQPPARQNLLAQMFALDPQRTSQLVQFESAQVQQMQTAEREKAAQDVREAQWVLSSQHPKTLLKVAFPDELENFEQIAGIPLEEATDDQVREVMQFVIAQRAPLAGLAPEGFTLSEGQVRFDARGRPIAAVPKTPSDDDREDKRFTRANVLRDEYTAQTKDFSTIAAQYGNILATAQSPSAAGDISLLTSYMKMLDPASTVREGEFANAENAGGVPTKLRAQYNKILTGERLTPEQRQDFVTQANNLFAQRRKQAQASRDKYVKLAERAGVDPRDVVGDQPLWEPPSSAQGGAVPVGQSVTINGFTVTRKK